MQDIWIDFFDKMSLLKSQHSLALIEKHKEIIEAEGNETLKKFSMIAIFSLFLANKAT